MTLFDWICRILERVRKLWVDWLTHLIAEPGDTPCIERQEAFRRSQR